jgi:thiol-disulfide isomerase/thioredoxin
MKKKHFLQMFWMLLVCGLVSGQGSHFTIDGQISNPTDLKPVTLCIWDGNFILEPYAFEKAPHKEIMTRPVAGKFHFNVDLPDHPVYIYLGYGEPIGNSLQPYYPLIPSMQIAEPGDSINVKVGFTVAKIPAKFDPYAIELSYSGKGTDKYICRYLMEKAFQDSIRQLIEREGYMMLTSDTTMWDIFPKYKKRLDESMLAKLNILSSFRSTIDGPVYKMMYANLLGGLYAALSLSIRDQAIYYQDSKKYLQKLKEYYTTFCYSKWLNLKDSGYTDTELTNCTEYINYLINRANALAEICKYTVPPVKDPVQSDSSNSYLALKTTYKGLLRDQILYTYFEERLTRVPDFGHKILDAIDIVKDDSIRASLTQLYNHNRLGQPGYNFKLTDKNGVMKSFQEFKGKVVLVDYWYTGCGHCIEYFKQCLAPLEKEFENNKGVLFVTINIDLDRSRWLHSLSAPENADQRYTSDLAVNLFAGNKNGWSDVVKYYDVTAFPHPMLFDQAGILITDQGLRDLDSLRAKIMALLKSQLAQ